MQIAKITAAIILIIMAWTWRDLSVQMGVMVAVSDNFMWLSGALITIVTGGSIGDFLSTKFQVKK